MLRLHLCELELRRGDWAAADALLEEWAESSDFDAQFRPQYQRCQALLAAGRGDPVGATRWASDAVERARATACVWDELEARRASGIAALLAREPRHAAEELSAVWEHCEREGILDPGAFSVAPELVEASLEAGALDAARAVTDRLRDLAEPEDHPWALATARRCGALISLTEGTDDAAAGELRAAASEFERLGFRFDSARCLLSLGRLERRGKQWAAARETLEEAEAAFLAIGSDGWAESARSEKERVGGRRRAEGDLTPSERRVVELAADGLANKEIASALYVTVNTVEVHLARAYAKLGVRSRSQLAKRLSTRA
jgi:DNA-binding CsgD family transcriptional regulator